MCYLIVYAISKASGQQQAISSFGGVKSYTWICYCVEGWFPLIPMLFKGQKYVISELICFPPFPFHSSHSCHFFFFFFYEQALKPFTCCFLCLDCSPPSLLFSSIAFSVRSSMSAVSKTSSLSIIPPHSVFFITLLICLIISFMISLSLL